MKIEDSIIFFMVIWVSAEVFYTCLNTEGFKLMGYLFLICGTMTLTIIKQIKEQTKEVKEK